MARFKIEFDGRVYDEWNTESLMLSEARELKKWLGLNPPAWLTALNDDDAEAVTALICLLRRRHGEPDLRFSEVDGDLATLTVTPLDVDEEGSPDPTEPGSD